MFWVFWSMKNETEMRGWTGQGIHSALCISSRVSFHGKSKNRFTSTIGRAFSGMSNRVWGPSALTLPSKGAFVSGWLNSWFNTAEQTTRVLSSGRRARGRELRRPSYRRSSYHWRNILYDGLRAKFYASVSQWSLWRYGIALYTCRSFNR